MKRVTFVKVSIMILTTAWMSISYAQNKVNNQSLHIASQGADSIAHPLSDSGITAKIKSKFIGDKLFGQDVNAITIEVETNNSIVHLTGTAENQGQIDNAVKLSNSVTGVTKVVNDVTLKK